MRSDTVMSLYQATNATVDPPIYDVDQLLFKYTSQQSAGFTADILPNVYFTSVSGIRMTSENPTDVGNRILGSTIPVVSKNITLDVANSLASTVDIRVTIDRSGQASPQLCQTILTGIGALSSSAQSQSSAVTQNHGKMDDYMRDIVKGSCLHFMRSALQSTFLTQSIPTAPSPAKPSLLFEAADNLVTGLTNTRRDILIETVSQLTRNTLVDILTSPDVSSIPVNFLSTMLDNDPLYYKLRTNVVNNLIVTSNNTVNKKSATVAVADLPAANEDILLYMKRIVVDLYIKCCYPLVYYDLFGALLKRYADDGDFVNVRIALLAKVFYVYNMLDYINTVASSNQGSLNPATTSNLNNIYTSIVTNLNNYITRLNNLDVVDASGRNTMKEIVKDLQNLSTNVVQQSTDIDSLRNDIASNQLALRNILTNYETVDGLFRSRANVFWVVVALLVAIIVLNSIFVLWKPDIVYYISGIAIVTILTIQLVAMIIRMTR